jgi:2-octaprenyl-6-methoxyphenol hydroxylase
MHYDLIIVGGGLVGSGLALALKNSGLAIALIDARLPTATDPRLFALSAGSCAFLSNLGVWSALSPHAAPIHQVHVSHRGHFGATRLNREEAGLAELGNVVPAAQIEQVLYQAVAEAPHVTLYQPARLIDIKQTAEEATLTIQTEAGEKKLIAPIVLAADGTESTVRTQLGIGTTIFDYNQSAIVTRTQLKRPHQQIAYERFTEEGAIAMLPLINQECATIWSGQSDKMSALLALDDITFTQKLQDTFGYRLGAFLGNSKRHHFPLRMVRAEKAVHGCVMLLGNAAHTLHPIAAQGFNLAVYEVAALVEAIFEKVDMGQSLKAADVASFYERTQKQQAVSIGVSHRLSRWFNQDSRWMKAGLQLGMMGLDVSLPIKRKFIERMTGKSGRVPALLLTTSD